MDKGNHLINEKSPYLKQHAYNPVDWYPWCDEAFEKAKDENKPIFLSIGYSTCHWCHVMARESFEDEEIAEILNSKYISIKVDREEFPDVDKMYMDAAIIFTQNGGWPLSVFMTHDKKPFFIGTYFPKSTLKNNLNLLYETWDKTPAKIKQVTYELIEIMNLNPDESDEIDYSIIEKAFKQLNDKFDEVFGGFAYAPKFPSPQNLFFLISYYFETEDEEALNMIKVTLDGMYQGGIFDHVGGGFSRYSVDERWLVPHFEKMTYDNALLAIAYSIAGTLIDEKYLEVADRTIKYCLNEMIEDEAFFTAQDADSEGKEGKYYVFTPNEIRNVLGEEDGRLFSEIFDIKKEGNFQGRSIPNLIKTNLNIRLGKTEPYDKEFAKKSLEKLYEYRIKRVQPLKDKKILSSNNAMMIYALAVSGKYINYEYIEKAEEIADFVLNNMIKEGRLYTSYQEGVLKNKAVLDDYAYLIWGLIELNQVSLNNKWLDYAQKLTDDMIELFYEDGIFYLSGKDVDNLPIRIKSTYDGATPSGNNIAMENLYKLYNLKDEEKYLDIYDKVLDKIANLVNQTPLAFVSLIPSLMMRKNGGTILNLNLNEEDLKDIKLDFYNPFLMIKLEKVETYSSVSLCENKMCSPESSLKDFNWDSLK